VPLKVLPDADAGVDGVALDADTPPDDDVADTTGELALDMEDDAEADDDDDDE
jgi:hypothetical protein